MCAHGCRDALIKMQDVYTNNSSLGDPGKLNKDLEDSAQKLDKLKQELHKFEVCLT